MEFDWSKYQLDIFEEMRSGKQNVLIEARAGSAKTTSLIKSLSYVPDGQTWLLVAFNKIIAEELKERAPQSWSGEIRTLHSLGLKSLYKVFPKLRINDNKTSLILDGMLGKDKKLYDVKYQLSKAISLCKGYLIDGPELIDFVLDEHDIDTCEMDREQFVETTKQALALSAQETNIINFDDMIWFVHIHKVATPKYHLVLCDETQDLNKGQIELVLKSCKRNGRIFCYLDPAQGIYSWRGASLEIAENLEKQLNAKKMPLSISYRCPISVIEEAQKLVPDIEVAPNAIKGEVKTIKRHEMMKMVKPGNVILSRANAPMVPIALSLLKAGTPAFIRGRDIGANLVTVIKKSKRKNLYSFIDWLDEWESKEIARLVKKNRDTEVVTDKAECLRALAASCNTLEELKKKIKNLFVDVEDKDKIQLSTVHKFKGLEAETVFILKNTLRYDSQAERNIVYVAITRSKNTLMYVLGNKK